MDKSTNMAEDDGWLEAEIQKELDAINSSELDVHYDDEEPPLEDDDDLTSEVLMILTRNHLAMTNQHLIFYKCFSET